MRTFIVHLQGHYKHCGTLSLIYTHTPLNDCLHTQVDLNVHCHDSSRNYNSPQLWINSASDRDLWPRTFFEGWYISPLETVRSVCPLKSITGHVCIWTGMVLKLLVCGFLVFFPLLCLFCLWSVIQHRYAQLLSTVNVIGPAEIDHHATGESKTGMSSMCWFLHPSSKNIGIARHFNV